MAELGTVRKSVFYRSALSEGPMLVVFAILTYGAWYLTSTFPASVRYENLFGFVLPIPLFALPPLVVFFLIIHRLGDNRYEIWDDHVRAVTGILSLEKDDTRIEYGNIRAIEVKRSLYGRVFNIGDLVIVSSAISGVEVLIDQVSDPSKYRDMILREMHSQGLSLTGHHEPQHVTHTANG